MTYKLSQYRAVDYFLLSIKVAALSISLAISTSVNANCIISTDSFLYGSATYIAISGNQLQCSGVSGVVDISTLLPTGTKTISATLSSDGFDPTPSLANSLPAANLAGATVGQLIIPKSYSIVGADGQGAGILLLSNSKITTLSNSGDILGATPGESGSAITVTEGSSITTLNNYSTGQIIGQGSPAIYLQIGGEITTINNAGYIGTSTPYSVIYNAGTIGTIINTGSIVGGSGAFGIENFGLINTINNAQGFNSSSPSITALTYKGALPTFYNIIMSPTSYGKLAVTGGSGAITFGIYAGSIVTNGTYAAVLRSSDNTITLNNTYGNFGSGSWLLSPEGDCTTSCIWDLIISGYYAGPSTADTQQSLANTAAALQNTYTLQNSVLANSFTYDCALFDKNNICISAGGRNTAVSAANGLNNTSALLIAAYRPHPNYRIGAYADQNLSVNNAGSTVTLGNNTPLIGLFGVWNQRLDGTGTEVKVSAAYGQKNTTITRQVVGTSEAGSGSSQLNSQGAQVLAKYGFGVADNVIVSPYAGLRYTQNNMGGYTEGASSSVTAPLTYSALNTNATTALAGVGASYRFIPQATAFASAGVETDTNTNNGTYSATGVSGLTPVNFNANPVKTRPTAMLGATYDVAKNQRLGITGIYRQEAYQAVQTTTVMATYTVGL